MTSPTSSRPHWFDDIQEVVATDGIPTEEENVPGILLGKKINGDRVSQLLRMEDESLDASI
jgi:hypothetical protein